MVLAENATEVAGREEYRPRASGAGDGWFFPEVEPGVGYDDLGAGGAEPPFSLQAVGAAPLRTELAVTEKRRRMIHGQYYSGSAMRKKAGWGERIPLLLLYRHEESPAHPATVVARDVIEGHVVQIVFSPVDEGVGRA